MQPLRPQGHLAPPRLTTMWPISPAAPRPSQGLPSRTMPPPTPVPQKTPIRLWNSRPAPRWNSASVATWTSLPTRTSVPRASFRVFASGKLPSQPGRLRAPETTPVFSSASPGRADPDARRARRSRRRPARPPPAAPPPSRRRRPAARRWSASACAIPQRPCPAASTTTVWIFVPPRSMPPAQFSHAAQSMADPGPTGRNPTHLVGFRPIGPAVCNVAGMSAGGDSGGGGSGGRSGAGTSAIAAGAGGGGSTATPPRAASSSATRSRARCWRRSMRDA